MADNTLPQVLDPPDISERPLAKVSTGVFHASLRSYAVELMVLETGTLTTTGLVRCSSSAFISPPIISTYVIVDQPKRCLRPPLGCR